MTAKQWYATQRPTPTARRVYARLRRSSGAMGEVTAAMIAEATLAEERKRGREYRRTLRAMQRGEI